MTQRYSLHLRRRGLGTNWSRALTSVQTHISELTTPPELEAEAPTKAPCLVIRGPDSGERVAFLDASGRAATVIGRTTECDVVLEDNAVSRRHVMMRAEGASVEVTDLGSTNGSFVDGVRLEAPVRLGVGDTVQMGRHRVTIDWRDPSETEAAAELARDLERASHYVMSMLPRPVAGGPVLLDWAFTPSTKLGGDIFGYHALDGSVMIAYLIDVTGHGVGAAMHSTSILSTLRRQALPRTDFRDPGAVLTRLNDFFPMEDHDGLCFTIWYGAYDTQSRILRYGSGGHHPAFLLTEDGQQFPLRMHNPILGVMPGHVYEYGEVGVPARSRMHVFSDGCFEITAKDGRTWGLADFLPLLSKGPSGLRVSAAELEATVRAHAEDGPLADDVSIMSFTFN